jgi:hypothetical protein
MVCDLIRFSVSQEWEAMKMKGTIGAGLIAFGALTATFFWNNQTLAGESRARHGWIVATLSSSALCGRVSEANSSSLHCRSNNAAAVVNARTAAVTCGSNQWCCRRDFSKGTCVKCCSK